GVELGDCFMGEHESIRRLKTGHLSAGYHSKIRRRRHCRTKRKAAPVRGGPGFTTNKLKQNVPEDMP
ncbi:TPA: hypothetical protein ACXJUV_004816, partial [Serratia marcescens]